MTFQDPKKILLSDLKLLKRLRLHYSHLNELNFWPILRAQLIQCVVVVLNAKEQITTSWELYSDLRLDLLNGVFTMNQTMKTFSNK